MVGLAEDEEATPLPCWQGRAMYGLGGRPGNLLFVAEIDPLCSLL